MRHNNIVKCVYVSPSNLCSMILAKILNTFKYNKPCVFKGIYFSFYLPRNVVCNILKHWNSYQVVINIIAFAWGIKMNCIQNCPEVWKWQLAYVITYNEFETTETTCGNLILLCLYRLWNRKDNYAPSVISYLLATNLNYFFQTL